MQDIKRWLNYSYPPHKLGFCGPLRQAQGLRPKKITRHFLDEFEGVRSYCHLIAKKNKIKNPYSYKVLEAYWMGNKLLEKVKKKDLQEMIREDFVGLGKLTKARAESLAKKVSSKAVSHHSFHVLHIGSVTGTINIKGKLKDLCRIGWGEVEFVGGPPSLKLRRVKIKVKYQPLVKNKLGKEKVKEIVWNKKLVPKVKKGDWVAFHWNTVVDVLSKKDVENLKKYTLKNL